MLLRYFILVSLPLVFLFPSVGAGAPSDDLQLIAAAKREDAAAVGVLLTQDANVNATQGDGATALHWAAHRDDLTTATLLVEAGAAVDVSNDLGVTPLMLASTNGSDAMIAKLLVAGADPNLRPPGRETALMTAAWTGNVAAVKLLLTKGADVNAAEDRRGQTALMWASSEGHPDVVRVLLEHGADVHARTTAPGPANRRMRYFVRTPTALAFTPLLFTARVGDTASMRLLLEAGADVNVVAHDGLSALALATVRGHVSAAMLLLKWGADPNLADAGYSALHWAAGVWETDLTIDNITS